MRLAFERASSAGEGAVAAVALNQGEPFVRSLARRWYRDKSATAMVEYALLVAVISLTVMAAAQTLGLQISAAFSKVGVYIASAQVPPSP